MMDKKNKDVEFDAQKYYSNSGYSIDDFFKDENPSVNVEEESSTKKGISINFDFISKIFNKIGSKSSESLGKIKGNTSGDTKINIIIIILLLCIFGVGLYVILSGGSNVIRIS